MIKLNKSFQEKHKTLNSKEKFTLCTKTKKEVNIRSILIGQLTLRLRNSNSSAYY